MATKENDGPIVIESLRTGTAIVGLIGESAYVSNRMSAKVKQSLLSPEDPGLKRRTASERAQGTKHDPLAEYQGAIHRMPEGSEPLLAIPAVQVKRALAAVAKDVPGANKAQLGRLVWLPGELLPLFGLPQLHMAVVRMADMSHTPDIRTRAAVRTWATIVEIRYVMPLLTESGILNLLAAAGQIIGVGDGRQEKGVFSFGQFEVVSVDDPRLKAIVTRGNRAAQEKAMASPTFYDDESLQLYESWAPAMARACVGLDAKGEAKQVKVTKKVPVASASRNGA